MRRDYKPPDANPTDHELVTQLKRLRYDLTEMQGKVSEALRMAAQLKLEAAPPNICPECKTAGITHDLRTKMKLAEHRYHSHDGPLPNHYAAAEAIALDGIATAALKDVDPCEYDASPKESISVISVESLLTDEDYEILSTDGDDT